MEPRVTFPHGVLASPGSAGLGISLSTVVWVPSFSSIPISPLREHPL